MTSPLRLVVFDVDGTLVDSQGDIVGGMCAAFEQVGMPAPNRAAIMSGIGLSLPNFMTWLTRGADQATRDALVEAYKQIYADRRRLAGSRQSSPLFAHTRAVLDQLHAQPEILLAIATGKSRRGLDILLEAHDIRHLFISTQCADDHPSKPHPSMLLSALSDAGVEASNAVMIGDTRFDSDMARAAGLDFIGVSWGYHSPETLIGAKTVVDDMRALPDVLNTLWERNE